MLQGPVYLGELFRKIMNYDDGMYAGQFIGGMYSAAYFENDIETIINKGLACIPDSSLYATYIRDEIRYLYGEPGKDAVIARRKGDKWYIAGINGEKTNKEFSIDLSFLPENLVIELITDGDDNGFKREGLKAGKPVTIPMAAL